MIKMRHKGNLKGFKEQNHKHNIIGQEATVIIYGLKEGAEEKNLII